MLKSTVQVIIHLKKCILAFAQCEIYFYFSWWVVLTKVVYSLNFILQT